MGNTNSSSEDTWCKVHSECKHYKLNLSHVGFDVDISKSICMDNQSTSNTSCMYPFCVAALSYHFECSRWVFPAFMPTSGAYGFNGSLLLFFFKLSWWIFLSTWMQLYVHVGNTVSVLCGWVHVCACLFMHVVKFCMHPVTFSRLLGLSKWNIFHNHCQLYSTLSCLAE